MSQTAANGSTKMDVDPSEPSKCTWHTGSQEKSPHTTRPFSEKREKVFPNILHVIGHTPLVKLNNIPKAEGIECDMYAKCEFLNPGGSVKDRIGYRMVLDAEERGLIKPDSVIIEPTSGNTGIGIALACAVKGYRCIIVLPEKMSNEKVDTLNALGAEIVRTPTDAAYDDPRSNICVAQRLHREIPNSIVLNQYKNPGNPLAHYDQTAAEIVWALDGRVDAVVLGAGTGGTVTGVGRGLRDHAPHCRLVAVDPYGSILSQPAELNETDVTFYEVEGIGYDFIPTVLDRSVVDEWVKSDDSAALPMSRRLIREEGLLAGGSSGSAMVGALQVARRMKRGQALVVILPDGVRNYMTKLLSDNWMEARDFKPIPERPHWWWNLKLVNLSVRPTPAVRPQDSCQDVLGVLRQNNIQQTHVISDTGMVKGVISVSNILSRLSRGGLLRDAVLEAVQKVQHMRRDETLGKAARVLEKETSLLLTHRHSKGGRQHEEVLGIVTADTLLTFITENKQNGTQTDPK